MPTPVWLTGFEHGVTGSSGSGLFNATTQPGNVVMQTAVKRSGSYAMRLALTTACPIGQVTRNVAGAPAVMVSSFYVYIDTAPSATVRIAEMAASTGNNPRFGLSTTNFVLLAQTSVVATGPAFTASTWYLVDWSSSIGTTGSWKLSAAVNGSAAFSGSAACNLNSFTYFNLGTNSATGPAYTVTIDDVVLSTTDADYPIGQHDVVALTAAADGTHNAGTNVMEDAAGNDIGTAASAWSQVNDVPLTAGSTTYVRQSATGAANYAEVQFSQLSDGSAVAGVRGIVAFTASAAATNAGATIMVDGNSTSTAIYGTPSSPSNMGQTAYQYYSASPATPASGWSQVEVNLLRMRIGYSTDVDPQPRWQALMYEVARVPAASTAAAALIIGYLTAMRGIM